MSEVYVRSGLAIVAATGGAVALAYDHQVLAVIAALVVLAIAVAPPHDGPWFSLWGYPGGVV